VRYRCHSLLYQELATTWTTNIELAHSNTRKDNHCQRNEEAHDRVPLGYVLTQLVVTNRTRMTTTVTYGCMRTFGMTCPCAFMPGCLTGRRFVTTLCNLHGHADLECFRVVRLY
jgi:hypothetical protein